MPPSIDPTQTPTPPPAHHRRTVLPFWLAWSVPALIVAGILWTISPEMHGVAVFLAGGVFLVLGGNWLVESAVSISTMYGLSPLVIGLTVVAFGTSAPELALNLSAAINNTTGLSFGNVIGSNIANITMVLGCAALISPVAVSDRVVIREAPWLLAATGLFGLLALFTIGTAEDGSVIQGWTRLGGGILLTGFLASIITWFRLERKNVSSTLRKELEGVVEDDALKTDSRLIAFAVLLLGIVLLGIGGRGAEWGAVQIAAQLGIDEVVVGLTIVAIATSLPEVTTSIIASMRDENDLAIGNIVGSNIFNLLLVMGATALVRPVVVPDGGWIDLGIMAAVTVLLFAVIRSPQRQLRRKHGAAFLALFVCYIVFTFFRASS